MQQNTQLSGQLYIFIHYKCMEHSYYFREFSIGTVKVIKILNPISYEIFPLPLNLQIFGKLLVFLVIIYNYYIFFSKKSIQFKKYEKNLII